MGTRRIAMNEGEAIKASRSIHGDGIGEDEDEDS
jgi:hypothetical protein